MISIGKHHDFLCEPSGSGSTPFFFHRFVAEYQARTSPRVRIGHFNVDVVAWSNFKPVMNMNGLATITNKPRLIDVANVGGGVDEALVAL